MHIDESTLLNVRHQRSIRDAIAHNIGTAHIEFEVGCAKTIKRYAHDKDEMMRRLGGFTYSWKVATRQFMAQVDKSVAEEEKLVEDALNALGLDPKEDYQIDFATGQVLILRNGAYEAL